MTELTRLCTFTRLTMRPGLLTLSLIVGMATSCASVTGDSVTFHIFDRSTRDDLADIEVVGISDSGEVVPLGRSDREGMVSVPCHDLESKHIAAAHFEGADLVSRRFGCPGSASRTCLTRGATIEIEFPPVFPFHVTEPSYLLKPPPPPNQSHVLLQFPCGWHRESPDD